MFGIGPAIELGLGIGFSGGIKRAKGIGGKEEKSSGNSFGGSMAVRSGCGGGGGDQLEVVKEKKVGLFGSREKI